ncbi:protein-export chaperone SecB [Porticoccus sp.]|uniref:protein-export chaperone SecB n=1 Tax=Porticoccus sp. TaxID=2024853 RepID=UPI003F69538E
MTEENVTGEAAAASSESPKFALQRVYLKDISFETPMGPEAFHREVKPQIAQELATKTNQLDETHFEVIVTVTITVKDGDDTVYLIEVHQAGIFLVKGLDKPQMTHVINVLCPATLFPYAREVVDNIVIKGTFPALMLPPVNFEALFAQAVEQAQEKKRQESESDNKEVTH